MLPLILAAVMSSIPVDHRINDFFSDVLKHANIFNNVSEAAAFLVRDTRGDVQCLLWPMTNGYQEQTFTGEIPRGTLAIVHTHPHDCPAPSPQDIDEAKALKLPIYVLTRASITLIDPSSGEAIPVVKARLWASPRLNLKCEDQWLAR